MCSTVQNLSLKCLVPNLNNRLLINHRNTNYINEVQSYTGQISWLFKKGYLMLVKLGYNEYIAHGRLHECNDLENNFAM